MSRTARGYATRATNQPTGTDPITGKRGYCEAGLHAANGLGRFLAQLSPELPEAERMARARAMQTIEKKRAANARWSKRGK